MFPFGYLWLDLSGSLSASVVCFFGSSLFHIRKTFVTDPLPVLLSFLVSYFRVIFLSHFQCFLISGSCCYFPERR